MPKFFHWVQANYKWLLPTVILVLMVPILVGVIITQNQVSDTQSELKTVQREGLEAQYASCERGNETRKINLKNFRQDKQAAERSGDEVYAEQKEKTIQQTLKALAPVAMTGMPQSANCELVVGAPRP